MFHHPFDRYRRGPTGLQPPPRHHVWQRWWWCAALARALPEPTAPRLMRPRHAPLLNRQPWLSRHFPASVPSEMGHHMSWHLPLALPCLPCLEEQWILTLEAWIRTQRVILFFVLWDSCSARHLIHSHLLDEDNRNLEAEVILILCKMSYPRILEVEDSAMTGWLRWLPANITYIRD